MSIPQYAQDPISDYANVLAWEWAVKNGHARIGDNVTLADLEKWRDMRSQALGDRTLR